MQINNISSFASDAVKKTGSAILNSSQNSNVAGKIFRKANDFVEGTGYNPGRGAYYFLMAGCVIAPRLLQAREPDEFREILTRDTVTILTILFAMKGLKSGMCSFAQKKAGMTLVNDTIGDKGKLRRILGYLNPEGGISALNSQEIIARYSGIKSKEALINTMQTISDEGGNIGKMFSIEKKQGIFSKLKGMLCKNKNPQTPLYNAAEKMFGADFASKNNDELINIVKNIDINSGKAFEGLEDIIGSAALEKKAAEGSNAVKQGILNSKNNPLTSYARNLASNFEWLSLAITAGFLGFGLPKINEALTKKNHQKKNLQNDTLNNQITADKTPLKANPLAFNLNYSNVFNSFKNMQLSSQNTENNAFSRKA